jgi:hypothetical protein
MLVRQKVLYAPGNVKEHWHCDNQGYQRREPGKSFTGGRRY